MTVQAMANRKRRASSPLLAVFVLTWPALALAQGADPAAARAQLELGHDLRAAGKCAEAIPQEELTRHAKSCRARSRASDIGRCPLCHVDIVGEDGWADHLLEGSGCPRNPRTAR